MLLQAFSGQFGKCRTSQQNPSVTYGYLGRAHFSAISAAVHRQIRIKWSFFEIGG